jgi:hypothetical protein
VTFSIPIKVSPWASPPVPESEDRSTVTLAALVP